MCVCIICIDICITWYVYYIFIPQTDRSCIYREIYTYTAITSICVGCAKIVALEAPKVKFGRRR